MKIEHLEYFIEVVNSKSINKAAKKLFVTQPTVTSTIKTLENDLGFQLVERSHKGVKLTEKGKVVFEDAKRIVEMKKKWRHMDERDPVIGEDIHIAVIPAATGATASCVSELKKAYPSINIQLHDGRKYNMLNMIEKGRASIGIFAYIDDEKGELYHFVDRLGFEIQEVVRDKYYIFLNSSHSLSQKKNVSLNDIKKLPIVIYAGDDPAAKFFLKYFKEDECYYANDLSAMMSIALQGEAAAVCTKLYSRYSPLIKSKILKMIEVQGFDIAVNYCLIYPSAHIINETEKIVINSLIQKIII